MYSKVIQVKQIVIYYFENTSKQFRISHILMLLQLLNDVNFHQIIFPQLFGGKATSNIKGNV